MSSASLSGRSFSESEAIRFLQEELAATNHEVMMLTLELEERVAARTAELSQTNQALEEEIAERKKAEAEIRLLNHDLEQRAAQLEAVNRDLEAFSYSVSHDLRSPLRHIAGFAEVLREDEAAHLSKEGMQHLEKITRAAAKMAILIDDLLRFARYSHVEINANLVDLNELTKGVIDDFRADLNGRIISWKRDFLPKIRADAALLRQVFVNLISNAVKYTSQRDIGEIAIGCKEDEQAITLWIRDNGVGFEQSCADKLFRPFERLHTQEQFEGVGIGLATVHKIITRHGGQVWAEGKLNEGAAFYFTLPKHL
jgi:light-regulated signal transduction histidine kinase (bacteriophytochrome)